TAALAAGLRELGFAIENGTAFDTLTVSAGGRAAELHAAARARRMNLREIDADRVGISLDETTTSTDVEALWAIFAAQRGAQPPAFAEVHARAAELLPPALAGRSPYLTHPVFNSHHSETEMLRYIRRLADKDL